MGTSSGNTSSTRWAASAGDIFDVRVYGEEDLTGTFQVAQDGSIDYPFIGRVRVAGLEPTEVADLITHKLKGEQYLKNPQVSILVKEYNSKRVSVIGAVAHPGTFPLSPGMTVVQAITEAGGFSPLASKNSTALTRTIDGHRRTYHLRAGDVSEGQGRDLTIRAGDIIYVPERIF